MRRELTFYPETERTRDLLYSEYTSCDRSIHVLLQDNSGPQYRFLLQVYREIVARYLSTSKIHSPIDFINDLVARLEELGRLANFTVNDLKSMGFFVMLRSADVYYLLLSREDDVFIHSGGETLSLAQTVGSGAERLHLHQDSLQEELFPQNLREGLLVFRLDAAFFTDRDIVLGCGEEDRSTVLQALSDPLWLSASDRRNSLSSKFITRRVLALRFDDALEPVANATVTASRMRRLARHRSRALVAAGVVAFLAIAYWATSLLPDDDGEMEMVKVAEPLQTEQVNETPLDQEGVADTTRLTPSWKRTFGGAVTSSPAFYESLVVFGCRDGNTYALERETGDELWTYRSADGVGASPIVAGGTVIIADYQGNVAALDARNGSRQWQRALGSKVVSSPSAMNGKVVVGCYDGYAYCLSMTDGALLWKQRTRGRIRASTTASGSTFYVASYDGYLYALDETGKVRWRYQVGGQIASSPIVHHDLVIIGAPDGAVHAVDATAGSVRWKHMTDGAVKSTAVVESGLVYAGSNDRHVYCLNVVDGSRVWRFKTDDIVLSQPHVTGGVVYVGSYDNYLYSLDSKTGRLLDRFQTEAEIFSSPIVDDGSVYFGNNKGDFISLNIRGKKAL